jgi:hypothetical protein
MQEDDEDDRNSNFAQYNSKLKDSLEEDFDKFFQLKNVAHNQEMTMSEIGIDK